MVGRFVVEDRLAESVADDMLALVDHLGGEQVAVLSLGNPAAILFAAAHPERTKAVVLFNATARVQPADDYPEATPPDPERMSRFRRDWGTGALLDLVAPSAAGDARLRRWMARCERWMCTAEESFWARCGQLRGRSPPGAAIGEGANARALPHRC